MSDDTKVITLLEAALLGAAEVAQNRLGREVRLELAELPVSSAILRFDLPFTTGGKLSWLITNDDATGLSDLLIGGNGDRGAVLTELHLDALTSAFSDMISQAVDAMALGVDEPLKAGEIDLAMQDSYPAPETGQVRTVHALQIEGFGPLVVMQIAEVELSQWLDLHALVDIAPTLEQKLEPALEPSKPVEVDSQAHADSPVSEPVPSNVVPIASAASSAAQAEDHRSDGDLEMLMNVPLPLTVELGATQRTIRELVDFSIGSIIELGKLAGDPLDIKVNDRVIARGEVVVIEEEFGIRVTEIVSPSDRLRGLG